MRRLGAAAALAAASLTLAGCSAAPAGEPTGDPAAAATTPTSLTVTTGFAIDTLDPVENGFWAPEFGYGDLLMKPVPGGTVEPWVLESLTAKSDTVWTLKIRSGVRFQNGTPLDGDALAKLLTFHLGRDETAAGHFPGASAKAVDATTVELTTAAPTPTTPSLLANEGVFPLFDLAAYEKAKATPDALVAAKIYVGPYTVEKLTPEQMDLAPTPGYYGGEPALKDLTVRFVPDAPARIKAVQAGEADLALYPPTSAARQLANDTTAKYLVADEDRATGGPMVFLNQRAPILADVRVRQAIQAATDYRQLAEQVMNGLYDVSGGIYPSFLPYAVDGLSTHPAKAASTLDAAGWTRTGEGTRTKDGKPLTLTVLTYPQQPDVGTLALGWQAQLKEVGIDLRIREVEDIDGTMTEPAGWDLGLSNNGSLGMTGTDPVTQLTTYFASTGERNRSGVADPQLDALIEKVRQAGPADRDGLLEQAQQRILDQAHGWTLAYKRTPVVVSPALADYPVPVANLWLTPYS